MKYCPNCGTGNEDYASACSGCGTALGGGSPGTKRTPTGIASGALVKIGAAIAAVGLVAGGVFLGAKLLKGNALSSAYEKTTDAFVEEVKVQRGIAAFTDLLDKYEDSGKYTLELIYQNDVLQLDSLCDYSRPAKKMTGELKYSDHRLEIGVDYAIKKDVIQFTCPGQLEDIYGFSVKKLGNKLNNSALTSLLPIDFSALSDVDFFAKSNWAEFLNQQSNGKFDILRDSVKVTYLDKREVQFATGAQKCRMYQVTWDEKALTDLINTLGGKGLMAKLVGFVVDLVPQIDGDCRCYINEDGCLVGVDLVSVGNRYLFMMEGTQNPWDKFTLTITSLYGDAKVYTGGLYSSADGIQMYLQNQEEIFLAIEYDNKGDFSVHTDKHGTIVYGNISVAGKEAALELNLGSAQMGTQKLVYRISALEEAPDQLSKYYVNLLDMDFADWQRLLLDLGISVK